MSLLDLIIIYFAAGAPFGVYKVTTLKKPVTPNVVFRLLLQIVLWPFFTIRTLIGGGNEQTDTGNELDRLQSEIEQLAFADSPAAAIFDFREVFSRYTGLAQAANAEAATGHISDIFEIGKVENPALATACLTRRNRERLMFHQMTARNEFVDMIGEMAICHSEVIGLATQAAIFVKDGPAVEDLAALASLSKHPDSQKDHPAALAA